MLTYICFAVLCLLSVYRLLIQLWHIHTALCSFSIFCHKDLTKLSNLPVLNIMSFWSIHSNCMWHQGLQPSGFLFPWILQAWKLECLAIPFWRSFGSRSWRQAPTLPSYYLPLSHQGTPSIYQRYRFFGICRRKEEEDNPLNYLFFFFVQSLCHVWLCDTMDCSMPGFPVLHHLPELAQPHAH